MLLLPAMFNMIAWSVRGLVTGGWKAFFEFWIDKLDLTGSVSTQQAGPASFDLMLPHLNLAAKSPDTLTWWVTIGITLFLQLLALHIPEKFLPFRYLLQLGLFVQMTALVFFAATPTAFPYSLQGYVGNALECGIWLVLVVPWVHALVYYIFDFSVLKKACLTLMTIGFLLVALPFQLMVHVFLMMKGSLLLMPLLYFLFGVWLLMAAFVALYGWAMSWSGQTAIPAKPAHGRYWI
jgi:hypothetical protein